MSAIKSDEQNNKPSSDRIRLIRLVQVGRRTLGLDEEAYRELLEQQSGKRSAAELTLQELDKVLVAMKAVGFKRPVKGAASQRLSPVSGALVRTGEIGVIRAVWITMHRHGLLRDGSETALNHYVERQTVRINKGIGVAEVAWLSEALAYRVLESLKNWHKREMVKALESAKRTVPINEKTGRVGGYQTVLVAFEQMKVETQDGR